MNTMEKRRLSKEAEMQLSALKRINRWRTMAISLSTIGVAMAYAGMAGANRNFLLGIPGIILVAVGICSALLLNLGLKNGRRNVEKILQAIQGNTI